MLHGYSEYVIGRMGIPYRSKNVCIISVVVDAPNGIISSLAGKLGMIKGISVKTVYSKAGALVFQNKEWTKTELADLLALEDLVKSTVMQMKSGNAK